MRFREVPGRATPVKEPSEPGSPQEPIVDPVPERPPAEDPPTSPPEEDPPRPEQPPPIRAWRGIAVILPAT
ncbi:MAG: hypothetical protein ABR576_12690 [Thermoanaerobaculia bacterium]